MGTLLQHPSSATHVERVQIETIYSEPTRKPGCRRHTISGKRADGTYLSLATVNDWIASLCLQAKDQQRPVTVTWRESRYHDRDLLYVVLQRTCFSGSLGYMQE